MKPAAFSTAAPAADRVDHMDGMDAGDGGYRAFLKGKVRMAAKLGFVVESERINPALKEHQRAMVQWMVAGGRRACFAAFGLGKSVVQLESLRLILEQVRADGATGAKGLIVCPLAVAQEFRNDAAAILGWAGDVDSLELIVERRSGAAGPRVPKFIRRIEETEGDAPGQIYLTNYETVRDGKLDPRHFEVASLDEAAVLRGFGGTKTFREFMALFAGDDRRPGAKARPTNDPNETELETGAPDGIGAGAAVEKAAGLRFRFVATATPSPNEYIELLAYAAFLGVMDVGQAKTRFFKRDSTHADRLTLHPHKEREFWLWVASWALFVQRPSDLGCSDDGYDLPPLEVRWHEVATDHRGAGYEKSGQGKMFRDAALGVQDAAAEKRNSLEGRIAKMLELREEAPDAHRILWHDLEAERHAIEEAVPDVVSVYGSQADDDKEQSMINFARGHCRELAGKPCMLGAGVNFQRHCAWAIFLGIGFKFNDFIQAIHRVHRFLQTHRVRIDLIYTEAERGVRKALERKWAQHTEMVNTMSKIIQEYGLSHAAMAHSLTRKLGIDERVEVKGERYTLVHNDCVEETRRLADGSVHLALTSIPFSTQYEYSPNYADFGHSEGNEEFFQQMDFLTPELLRALQPGRLACIHVKDRIVPGGMTGLGFQTVYPFHARCLEHYTRHGFAYMGMITITTDVVRENNQTYRLSYTQQCKDATRMGCGMPEYLLIFRKPQTDRTRGYADAPVRKEKERVESARCRGCGGDVLASIQKKVASNHLADGEAEPWVCPQCGTAQRPEVTFGGYSLHRWQVDAAGYRRSNGNRLLTPADLQGLSHAQMYQLWREHSASQEYDYEAHVRLGDVLRAEGQLPVTFALFPAHSAHPEVWSDITRMLTLNGAQSQGQRQMHLCPMQFDLADRVIGQWSMPGETVLDPFSGLGTVAYRAIKLGRHGVGFELNHAYFTDSAAYCRMAEDEVLVPTLFDLMKAEEPAGAGSTKDTNGHENGLLNGVNGKPAKPKNQAKPVEVGR